ncbi:MAG: sulfurtransferase complex subunit TusB [Gammaproteobacteria bacterium]|nr:sulfurtransferase complex subunit TusB [Gammaproteobacteria bacterium]
MSPTLSTLHTVNKSAYGSDALASCLRVARSGDAILLLEDGVYNAVDASALVGAGLARDILAENQSRAGLYALGYAPTGGSGGVRIYALREDLQARGIAAEQLPAHVEPIAYKDFVALVCTHRRTVSWF